MHEQIVAPARRKGFNAPFYPAFRLRSDATLNDLKLYLERLCSSQTPFNSGVMKVGIHSNHIYIEPLSQNKTIEELASNCVYLFDTLREKSQPIPVNGRMKTALTQRQIDNFVKWGHPYLFEDYKFSIQLTGPLQEKVANQLCTFLQNQFVNDLTHGVMINGLSLFGQESPEKPARLLCFSPFKQQSTADPSPINPAATAALTIEWKIDFL